MSVRAVPVGFFSVTNIECYGVFDHDQLSVMHTEWVLLWYNVVSILGVVI